MNLDDVDLKFWIPLFLLATLSFSVLNDLSDEKKCRPMNNGSVCFSEWTVLGVNTDLPIGFEVYGDIELSGFELTRYVFLRESDLVGKRSWPDGSSVSGGGNWSGSVPDFNVSVIEGTG